MIYATETPDHQFMVETSCPVNGKVQRITVANEAHAIRIARIWNRLYIIEKLTAWLLQRSFALGLSGLPGARKKAMDMIWYLTNLNRAAIEQLATWVNNNADDIRSFAPAETSGHFPYYQTTIRPILQFCEEMEAVKA